MAITMSALASATTGAGGTITSVATASVSPTANRLVIAAVHNIGFNPIQNEPPDTITGAGLTFTLITSQTDATTGATTSIWRAMAASPSTGAITASWSHSMYDAEISVFEFAGIDTSGTNGSGAIVQSAGNQSTTGSATSVTVTLSAFGSVSNGACYATGWTQTGATIRNCAPDTGWTEIHDTGTNYASGAGSAAIETQWRADNDTTAVGTWSGAGYIHAVAIEIKAAGAAATRQLLSMLNNQGGF